MTTVYLMTGVPGSGKSTFIREQLKELNAVYEKAIHISRDEIRFSLLEENDDYFAKEDLVIKTFIKRISESILKYDVVFIDATHLTESARNKILKEVENIDLCFVVAINFIVPLEICLERNAKRTGRERVPDEVVKKMFKNYKPAKYSEKFYYDGIINVDEKGEVKYV